MSNRMQIMNRSINNPRSTGCCSGVPQFASQQFSRRAMLRRAAGGFGALALSGMIADLAAGAVSPKPSDPLAPKPPIFPPEPRASSFCT